MRIDLVTIFPDYFTPLDLSLIGKAGEAGLVAVNVHDLRDWTHDRHRTVDDTPYGGGAGMVMKPDVWGEALDEIIAAPVEAAEAAPRRILAIPTPSGRPLTQRIAEDLTSADQMIVACGRYEGIDQRVAEHYSRAGIDVLEYSIGDYVLNGGEAAALVLVEAVVRLLDGFMGNPESIVEESHSNGLLEYPAYTKPRVWRELAVPEVLLGGDHEAIRSWRLDRALDRTASRRPDLIASIRGGRLDAHAREHLASLGFAVLKEGGARPLSIRFARPNEAGPLSALASRTFPLACPPSLSQEAIDAFVSTELSPEAFAAMLAEACDHRILVAEVDGELVGYTLTVLGGAHAMPKEMVRPGTIAPDAAYLSKCYLDADWQGSGIAGALVEAAVADVAEAGRNPQVVLGTNAGNKRAQKFYKRHGFTVVGHRVFNVGGVDNRDAVLVRNITDDPPA